MPHQEHKKALVWNNTYRFMRKNKGLYINYPVLSGWQQISYIDCMWCVAKLGNKKSTLCVS